MNYHLPRQHAARCLRACMVMLCILGLLWFGRGDAVAASSAQDANSPSLTAGQDAEQYVAAPTVAVVRAGGATLHAVPGDTGTDRMAAGTAVSPIGQSADGTWIAVSMDDGRSVWLARDAVILLPASALPVLAEQQLAPSPTETPVGGVRSGAPAVGDTAQPAATAASDHGHEPQPLDLVEQVGAPGAMSAAQVAVVGSAGAALLDQPGGASILQFGPGQLVYVIGASDDRRWLLAYPSGVPAQRGWLAFERLYLADLTAVPPVAAPEPTAQPEPTAAPRTVAVTPESLAMRVTVASGRDRLNVRGGPGTDYPILTQAADGAAFNVVGRNADTTWLQITGSDGGQGWVSRAYVAVDGDPLTLPVIDVAPPAPVPVAAGDVPPSTTGLDGTLVFQTGPGGAIYGYDLTTGTTWALTQGFDPAISPDGRTVAFVRDGGEQGLYLINIDGRNERLIFSGRTRLSAPKWSPDGSWIVFTRGDEYVECYQMGPSCQRVDMLPPGFKPRGDDVTLTKEYKYHLARVDRDGQNYRDLATLESARAADWNDAGIVYESAAGLQITADAPAVENRLVIFNYLKPFFADPDWQPNGGRIVYMGREASHTEIFAVNPDGSDVRALTRPVTTLVDEIPSNVAPAWSPDGRHIVFLSNRAADDEAGIWRLWVMDADGSNQRPLPLDISITYTYGGEQAVSWGPRG